MNDSIQFGSTPTRDWRDFPNEDDDDYSEDGTPMDRAFARAAMGFDPETDPDFIRGYSSGVIESGGLIKSTVKDAAHAPAGSPQGGQFTSSGGAGSAADEHASGHHDVLGGGGRVMNLVALPVKLEHAVMGAVKAGALKSIGFMKDIWSGGGAASEAGAKLGAAAGTAIAIGTGLKAIAKGGAKLYFVSWIAGNKAVEGIARAKDFDAWEGGSEVQIREIMQKGLSEGEVARVKAITAGYDILASKPIFLGLEHMGMPHLAAASLFVPTASVAYIAHATVTNPLAVAKAAGNAVKSVASLFKPKPGKAFDPADTNAAVAELCDAAKRHKGDDFFFAILPECIEYSGEHGGGITEAIQLAEAVLKEYPTPEDVPAAKEE